MNIDIAINWIDRLLVIQTGKHLSDLQIFIVEQVWLGRKYVEIAADYHCTEGHVKDIAAALWQLLSQLLLERVTKTNLKSIVQRHASILSPLTKKIDDRHFIGRDVAIARLDEFIAQGQRTIVIQGEGGVGKTTLAQQYLKTCSCDLILELSMAKETDRITPAEIVVEEWLRQNRFALIEFRGFSGERHACIKGRLQVWQVIEVARGYNMDARKTAEHLELSPEQVESAFQYYHAYPSEVEQALNENKVGYERLKQMLPRMERITVSLNEAEAESTA